MSNENPISVREANALQRSIDNLARTITKLNDTVEVTYVRKDVLEPQLAEINRKIAKHASYWDWLIKLVVAAVILSLLALVLKK